jgi:hypothetical protein
VNTLKSCRASCGGLTDWMTGDVGFHRAAIYYVLVRVHLKKRKPISRDSAKSHCVP